MNRRGTVMNKGKCGGREVRHDLGFYLGGTCTSPLEIKILFLRLVGSFWEALSRRLKK